MKLYQHRLLDALCGEYMLGTLRGSARRRFERALREEPGVASHLKFLQTQFTPQWSANMQQTPSPRVWKKISKDLYFKTPAWYERLGFIRLSSALGTVMGTVLATAVITAWISVQYMRPSSFDAVTIAELQGAGPAARLAVGLSSDKRLLQLTPPRPVQAARTQSYELWLIPAHGGKPVSLAVLGELHTQLEIIEEQRKHFIRGAKLAVSVEPAGGSPSGQPTGPIILAGEITL